MVGIEKESLGVLCAKLCRDGAVQLFAPPRNPEGGWSVFFAGNSSALSVLLLESGESGQTVRISIKALQTLSD